MKLSELKSDIDYVKKIIKAHKAAIIDGAGINNIRCWNKFMVIFQITETHVSGYWNDDLSKKFNLKHDGSKVKFTSDCSAIFYHLKNSRPYDVKLTEKDRVIYPAYISAFSGKPENQNSLLLNLKKAKKGDIAFGRTTTKMVKGIIYSKSSSGAGLTLENGDTNHFYKLYTSPEAYNLLKKYNI